jgi:hypothetical protein
VTALCRSDVLAYWVLTCDVVLDGAIGREPAGMCDDGVHAGVQQHLRVEVDRVNVAGARR